MNKEDNEKNFLQKIKSAHERFNSAVSAAYKKFADRVKDITKQIEQRKIEKLSAELKSHKHD